jgi:hypothetical protein
LLFVALDERRATRRKPLARSETRSGAKQKIASLFAERCLWRVYLTLTSRSSTLCVSVFHSAATLINPLALIFKPIYFAWIFGISKIGSQTTMFYQSKYCNECGERIESETRKWLISNRFCDACAADAGSWLWIKNLFAAIVVGAVGVCSRQRRRNILLQRKTLPRHPLKSLKIRLSRHRIKPCRLTRRQPRRSQFSLPPPRRRSL